jgi:hypothetical protein
MDEIMQLRSIDIDIDVHRHIETNRTSFGQTPNEILRELFGLPVAAPSSERKSTAGEMSAGQPTGDWSWKGVVLPAGTELRMTYNGRTHTGVVAGGAWQISGASYTSPSSAADALARSRDGKPVSLNGWTQWEVRKPGSNKWVLLDSLRPASSRERRASRRRAA